MATVSQEQLAEQIHAQTKRLVIAITGGGSGAISALLTVPGASRSILAAVVPYAPAALAEWLGGKPDEYCSPWTARAMAMSAFIRAQSYDPAADACGVSCTASLASDRPKRGPHRAHLAYQTASTTAGLALELEKGRRSRAEEEGVVTALILNHIAEACGAAGRVTITLGEHERIEVTQITAPQDQQDLLAGRTQSVPLGAALKQPRPKTVFPGAFHPLHEGHRQMARLAKDLLGTEVAYEISVVNVEKPPLDFIEIDQRARQFSPEQAVWLTRAPRFTEKAELFPGATFIVGADTIVRIGQSRFYEGDEGLMHKAVEQIAARGCHFLVFGRAADGTFRTLSDLQLPKTLAQICQEVPESLFRDDTSSTHLRQQQQTKSSDFG